jgi:hypothetical protein
MATNPTSNPMTRECPECRIRPALFLLTFTVVKTQLHVTGWLCLKCGIVCRDENNQPFKLEED